MPVPVFLAQSPYWALLTPRGAAPCLWSWGYLQTLVQLEMKAPFGSVLTLCQRLMIRCCVILEQLSVEAKPRGKRGGGAAPQLVPASNRVAVVVSQEDAGHVEEHMEDVGEDGPG